MARLLADNHVGADREREIEMGSYEVAAGKWVRQGRVIDAGSCTNGCIRHHQEGALENLFESQRDSFITLFFVAAVM